MFHVEHFLSFCDLVALLCNNSAVDNLWITPNPLIMPKASLWISRKIGVFSLDLFARLLRNTKHAQATIALQRNISET